MTAPLLATHAALTAVLCGSAQVCTHNGPTRWCERTADALFASGVVRDPATLADDESLVGRVVPDASATYRATRAVLRALAAALTEDPEDEPDCTCAMTEGSQRRCPLHGEQADPS